MNTKILIASLSIVFTQFAFAVELNESDSIKRLLIEAQAINPLIEEAQNNSDRQERDRFNYKCLVQDLNIFKHGLRAAVYSVRHIPKQYQALCSDYGYSGHIGSESEYLSMLIQELESLKVLLDEAKEYRNEYSRISLNYEAINADLNTIIYGIQNALIGSGDKPRKFPVLRGSFSQ